MPKIWFEDGLLFVNNTGQSITDWLIDSIWIAVPLFAFCFACFSLVYAIVHK